MLRSSPCLPPSPHWGMASTQMSNPLGGLVGSKTMSLRPVAFSVAIAHARYWLLRTRSIHGYRSNRGNRNAHRLGHCDVRVRGARMGTSPPERWRFPHHLPHRRSWDARRRYDDQEAVTGTRTDERYDRRFLVVPSDCLRIVVTVGPRARRDHGHGAVVPRAHRREVGVPARTHGWSVLGDPSLAVVLF